MKYYKKSVEIDEDFLDGIYQLGLAYLTLGKNAEALNEFVNQWISWDGKELEHDDALDAVYMLMKAAEGHIQIPRLQPDPMKSPMFGGKKKRTTDWSGMKHA